MRAHLRDSNGAIFPGPSPTICLFLLLLFFYHLAQHGVAFARTVARSNPDRAQSNPRREASGLDQIRKRQDTFW